MSPLTRASHFGTGFLSHSHLKHGFVHTELKGHHHLQVAMFRCRMHPDPCWPGEKPRPPTAPPAFEALLLSDSCFRATVCMFVCSFWVEGRVGVAGWLGVSLFFV